jgi:hypothetical protein
LPFRWIFHFDDSRAWLSPVSPFLSQIAVWSVFAVALRSLTPERIYLH